MDLPEIIASSAKYMAYGVGTVVALGAVTNQLLARYIFSSAMTETYQREPKIKIPAEIIREFNNLPDDFGAVHYINLATMLMENRSLGKGDCKDRACCVFDTYQELIRLNNRNELENKIRFVAGDLPDGRGHVQLEVEYNDKFITYEPNVHTPEMDMPTLREFSILCIDLKRREAITKVMARSENGTKHFLSTWRALFYPGGYLGLRRTLLNQ